MTGADINSAVGRLASPAPEVEPEQEQVEANEQIDEGEAIQAESDESTTEELEDTYTVKINGEEREVTLEELRAGYMMQSDYSKKTAEVAEKRKVLDQKESEMQAKLGEAEELIQFELDDLKSEEMLELKEYDPDAYWKKVERVNTKADKFKARKADQERKMLDKKQALLVKEQETLIQKVPEWMDQDVMNAEAKELYEVMANLGYSPEEISNTTDHRVYLLAREALKLQKIKQTRPEDKKVSSKPKSAKPSAATVVENVERDKVKQVRNKLKKTGSTKAAYELLSMR